MQPRQREGTHRHQARFFCDNCGHEVPFNAEVCPKCKKTFSGVRCPVCQFSGPPSQFQNGCPRCGYQARPTALGGSKETSVEKRAGLKRGPRKKVDFSMAFLLLIALALLITVIIYSNR